MIFVLNKQDLWSTAFYNNVSKFENWFERHVEKWGALGISVGEAPIKMSATDPRDIGRTQKRNREGGEPHRKTERGTVINPDIPRNRRRSAREPLEFKYSDVKFAIFGYQNRKSAIVIKSDDAPLHLLGAYPIEAIEVSSQSCFEFFWNLIDFSGRSVHWIMSLPFGATPKNPGFQRLVLVWQGLATGDDKLEIKKILDRNAVDIAEAAMSEDYWRSVISASPVIAACWRAQNKNRRVRVIFLDLRCSARCHRMVLDAVLGRASLSRDVYDG